MCQWRSVVAAASFSSMLGAGSARAESAPCYAPFEVREIFAGAPGCPDAQYLVLERAVDPPWAADSMISVRDSCFSETYVSTSVPNADGGSTRWLVGTPAAEAEFGIVFDAVVADLVLDPWGGMVLGNCGGIGYGGMPWPAGAALRVDPAGSQTFASPTPTNSRGDSGAFTGCGPLASDGGAPDGTVPDGAWPPPRPVCPVLPPVGDPPKDPLPGDPLRDADAPRPDDPRPRDPSPVDAGLSPGAGGRVTKLADAAASNADVAAVPVSSDSGGACTFGKRGSAPEGWALVGALVALAAASRRGKPRERARRRSER